MTRIDELVAEFVDNVTAQTDAIGRGDAKTGNRHAKRYIRAFEGLSQLGNEGRDALRPVMHAGRDDVRAMAAAFLLRHSHDEACEVLRVLSLGEGIAAFSAAETLKRWEDRTWQLDPG